MEKGPQVGYYPSPAKSKLMALNSSRRSLCSRKPRNGRPQFNASATSLPPSHRQPIWHVFGLRSEWTFICRTPPELKPPLALLENTTANGFFLALLGHPTNTEERSVFALPCCHGGLGMPTHHRDQRNMNPPGTSPSLSRTEPLSKI